MKKKITFSFEEKIITEISKFAEENCINKSKLMEWLWVQHLYKVSGNKNEK